MKIKNGDILQAKPALEAVLKLPAAKLTSRTKFWLSPLARALRGPLEDIEKTRVSLVEQYGEKTSTGFTVLPDRVMEFSKAYTQVLDIERDLNLPSVPLTEQDMEALTGEELMLLGPFLTLPDLTGAHPNGKVEKLEEVKAVK